jgi:hypothetical protein
VVVVQGPWDWRSFDVDPGPTSRLMSLLHVSHSDRGGDVWYGHFRVEISLERAHLLGNVGIAF